MKNGVFAQRETNGTYGAIYGNTTAGSNQANDLCVDYGIARVGAADAMRDPAQEESFFADYVWKDYAAGNTYEEGFSKTFTNDPLALTAVENRKRDVAQIGGEIYQTLAEAVNALTDGSVIRLIAGENDDYGLTVDTDTIRVEKPVTIELNGRDIGPSEKILFEVEDKGILTLQGEGQVQGTIRILDGQAILSGSAAAKKVVQEGGSLLLNSACGPLELSLGEGKAASYGSDFAPEKITVNLAEEVLKAVNEGTAEKVVLLTPQEGADGSSLLEKITVFGWTNRLYRLTVLPSGEIVLQKDTTPAVYVNGISGDDSAYGLSVDTPVRTLKQAEAIAREKGYSRIYVTGTLSVSGEETWSLAEGLTVKRYPDYDGNLIAVKDGGSLTLKDIVLDGAADLGAKDSQSLVNVKGGGSLTLDEGAVLQNNSRVDPDTNAYMAGGAVYVDEKGTFTMNEGALVRDNAASYGGGVFVKGEFIMNGGVIEDNRAVAPGGQNKASGGVMLYAGGKMTLKDGILRNNDSDYIGGAVSLGDYLSSSIQEPCRLDMEGGTITGNTASMNGGGIFVQMNCTAVVTGGRIENNSCYGGVGGGIYVNGGKADT